MDEILEFLNSYIVFDAWAFYILLGAFVLFVIQIYFYFIYYKKPASFYKKQMKLGDDKVVEKLSVSVVLIAKNDSENLKQLIPLLLQQDYENYEIVVVNDGSTDESQEYLERLVKTESKVYSTFSSMYEDVNSEKQRVLAMTIGIKAAKNDVLLFTETSCRPTSNEWIRSMVKGFSANKDIVLGYNRFSTPSTLWGKVCRFDNLLFSLQYLSMAIKTKPFIGTYRNIAYRKHLFFDKKGFADVLNFNNSEEVFINRIMTKLNTSVVEDYASFTDTKIENYWHWNHIKSIYSETKKHLKGYTASRFSIDTISRYLFYLVTVGLLSYSIINQVWIYTVAASLLFLIRFFVQLYILKSAAKRLDTKPFYSSLILMDLLQPIYNYKFYKYSRRK